MKVAGLFAGIGGLETGLASAGLQTSLLCEIWAPARAVLEDRFPHAPCHADVRDLKDLPADISMLVGGFPCQDLSQAGLTAGIQGKRSGLVAEVFRLIDAGNVPVVVLENVPFMLQLNRGQAMATLVRAFEERGYRWAYRVVNSHSFLPQRRERVFLVASKCDIDPSGVLLVDEKEPVLSETNLNKLAHGFYWTEGVRGLGWAVDATPTLKNGSTVGIASPPAVLLPSGKVITPDIRDAERLQGFSSDWTLAAERVSRPSSRWSLIGNAVSVPVAEWLGGRLVNAGAYDCRRDLEAPAEGRSWPKAARFDGRRRHAVDINSFPDWRKRSSLAEFLLFPGKPLSLRATTGFLSRTERAKLRFPEGFLERLRVHQAKMEGSGLLEAA